MEDLLQGHGRNELNQPICAGRRQNPAHKPHSLDVVASTSLNPSHHCDTVTLLYTQYQLSTKQMHKQMQQFRSLECCNEHDGRLLMR